MKFIRVLLTVILFIVCMPLSWYAAWDATGSVLATSFSLMIPTWGIWAWLLGKTFGGGFLVGVGTWILGLLGSYVPLFFFVIYGAKIYEIPDDKE